MALLLRQEFSFLRSLHDRAEPGEKDVVFRLVPDGDDFSDPGFFRGIPDCPVIIGCRVGGEGSVADCRFLESSRCAGRHVRIHWSFGKSERASAKHNRSQNHWGQNFLHRILL